MKKQGIVIGFIFIFILFSSCGKKAVKKQSQTKSKKIAKVDDSNKVISPREEIKREYPKIKIYIWRKVRPFTQALMNILKRNSIPFEHEVLSSKDKQTYVILGNFKKRFERENPGKKWLRYPFVTINNKLYGNITIMMFKEITGAKVDNMEPGQVYLYSYHKCRISKRFKKKLDQNNIAYTVFDVREDFERMSEMYNVFNRYKKRHGKIIYPVVFYNKKVMISPKFDEFIKVYNQ